MEDGLMVYADEGSLFVKKRSLKKASDRLSCSTRAEGADS
jgi:hypothetical protein